MWPDLGKFHHLDQYLKIFGNIFNDYLVLGKVFGSLWYNLYAVGQIFIAKNGQILKTQTPRLLTLGPPKIIFFKDQAHVREMEYKGRQTARLILACMLHPSMSHTAGWSYVIHGLLYFHPSTSLGSSISAALCIQPKIWRACSFYLTRLLWMEYMWRGHDLRRF